MIVLIAMRNMILGYGVRPAVYGHAVSIHPAIVLVALPAGFQLAGVVGLFAAVPVTAVLLAVGTATVAIVDPGPRPELPALVPGLARPGRAVELAAARGPRTGRPRRGPDRGGPAGGGSRGPRDHRGGDARPAGPDPRPSREGSGPGVCDRDGRRVPRHHRPDRSHAGDPGGAGRRTSTSRRPPAPLRSVPRREAPSGCSGRPSQTEEPSSVQAAAVIAVRGREPPWSSSSSARCCRSTSSRTGGASGTVARARPARGVEARSMPPGPGPSRCSAAT